jgi:diacylglycerol kinase family enzyme
LIPPFRAPRRWLSPAAALEHRSIRHVDVGIANGRMFLLMASVGFDAEVVHTLAASRGGRISHLTYIKPILSTMRSWSPPRLSIEIDGKSVVSQQQGMVVVANCRQYGWRIDPALRADMADGVLDVIFMPARSLLGVIAWAYRCRTRRHLRHPSLTEARGRAVVVRSDRPQHFQLDGDPPGVIKELLPDGFEAAGWRGAGDGDAQAPLELKISVCPKRLAVLTSADGPQTA